MRSQMPESSPLSHESDPNIIVSIAQTKDEIRAGMDFCGERYEKTYHTSWAVDPDILFVAKNQEGIVSTGALELGSRHQEIGAEKYFRLTPSMRAFIQNNRQQIAEFGRFSSIRRQGAQAVFHAAISYAQTHGIEYLFAWANPSVYTHLTENLDIPFWVIDVPVDSERVRVDDEWRTPPIGFFFRKEPPKLLLSVLPFWDLVNKKLASSYGKELDLSAQS